MNQLFFPKNFHGSSFITFHQIGFSFRNPPTIFPRCVPMLRPWNSSRETVNQIYINWRTPCNTTLIGIFSPTWMRFVIYFHINVLLPHNARSLHVFLQWGGFDALSIASYDCQSTLWSPSCLESESSWQHWEIEDEKIYFFRNSGSRTLFVHKLEENIMAGNAKWDVICSKSGSAMMSTTRHKCTYTVPQRRYLKRWDIA